MVDRFKARLVTKGYTQWKGIDYYETFTPVAKLVIIYYLLAITIVHNRDLRQLDVNNTFLYENLSKEVYMKVLPRYPCQIKNLVCKLNNSLYGLK